MLKTAFSETCEKLHKELLEFSKRCLDEDLDVLAKTIKSQRSGDEKAIPRYNHYLFPFLCNPFKIHTKHVLTINTAVAVLPDCVDVQFRVLVKTYAVQSLTQTELGQISKFMTRMEKILEDLTDDQTYWTGTQTLVQCMYKLIYLTNVPD